MNRKNIDRKSISKKSDQKSAYKNRPEIKRLPSGWYSIWIDGEWIDAACRTEEQAQDNLNIILKATGNRPRCG